MDKLLEVLANDGLAVALVVFCCYLLYRYVNHKLEIQAKEFENQLKEKKWRVSGKLVTEIEEEGNIYDLSLDVEEKI